MFNETQKKIIASALTCLGIVVILFFIVGIFKFLGSFISHFSNVLYPLVLAGVLFIMLKPIIDFINAKLKIPRTFCIIILYLLITTIISLLFIFIVPKLLYQLQLLILDLPSIFGSMSDSLLKLFPHTKESLISKGSELAKDFLKNDLLENITSYIYNSSRAISIATSSILGLISMVASFAVVPIYLFYMLESKRDISLDFDENTKWLSPKHREDLKFLITQFVGILTAFFRGQMMIALIMGILFALGFSIVGLKFGVTIGLIMGLLNIVPYLGSIIGLISVISVAIFQEGGGIPTLAFSLVVIIIVQLIESYLLTPKIMKKQTGLHPGVVMFSIFFWGVALKGIIGMILAIPLSAFIVVFWRLIRSKYLKNS